MKVLPFYYPTTTVFIDDNERFLSTITLDLEPGLIYNVYSNTTNALYNIKNNSVAEAIQLKENSCISNILLEIVHDPSRFKSVSAIVVDYTMPDRNGLEVCSELNGLNIGKIMLTGDADASLAVKAFNDGLIDYFITKNQSNFTQIVSDKLTELQHGVFKSLTHTIINLINDVNLCLLFNENFSKYFTNFINKGNIVEYYLIDDIGSYFMFDKFGKINWLLSVTEKQIQYYIELAIEFGASKKILNILKNRTYIPFFPKKDIEILADGDNWLPYFHKVKKQDLQGEFYLSWGSNLNLIDVGSENIVTFNKYLYEVWGGH